MKKVASLLTSRQWHVILRQPLEKDEPTENRIGIDFKAKVSDILQGNLPYAIDVRTGGEEIDRSRLVDGEPDDVRRLPLPSLERVAYQRSMENHKKRKATSDVGGAEERSKHSKKSRPTSAASDKPESLTREESLDDLGPDDMFAVKHFNPPDKEKPIVLNLPPGFKLPDPTSWDQYWRDNGDGSHTVTIVSQSHPTCEMIGEEMTELDSTFKELTFYVTKTYVKARELHLTKGKHLNLRLVPRIPGATPANDVDDDSDAPFSQKTTASTRAQLTEAFGTKKSKRAVESSRQNRVLRPDADSDESDNPLNEAYMSEISVAKIDDEDLISWQRANKPLPPSNLSTPDIEQVYPLINLVAPLPVATTLSQMPIAYWKDHVSKDKPIESKIRFVARHVHHTTQKFIKDSTTNPRQAVQVLRYIQLLVELHKYVSRLNSRKHIPPPEKWPEKTTSDSSLSTAFKGRIMAHFFPDNTASKHNKTFLVTTILALTLQIPPPNHAPGLKFLANTLWTHPDEITADLAMPAEEIIKLYKELGCKHVSMNTADLKETGWGKLLQLGESAEEGGKRDKKQAKVKFMQLKFPIEFPKISSGRRRP